MIIYLEDRRLQAADILGEFQHVSGGLPLLAIALKTLAAGEADWPLAALEAMVASLLLLIFLRDLRALLRKGQPHRSTAHKPVGWFDMAAGALLLFEAFHGHHAKPGYLRPPFLAGAVTILLGVLHGRVHAFRSRRRYLKLDEQGVECRKGPFRRFAFTWAKLESVEVSEKEAVFQGKDGQRQAILLRRYSNGDAIRNAIMNHAQAAGLLSSGPGEGSSAETAEMPDRRYDEVKSGNVAPVDGEEAFARLRRKSQERRNPS